MTQKAGDDTASWPASPSRRPTAGRGPDETGRLAIIDPHERTLRGP
jgi:hypothetical protein